LLAFDLQSELDKAVLFGDAELGEPECVDGAIIVLGVSGLDLGEQRERWYIIGQVQLHLEGGPHRDDALGDDPDDVGRDVDRRRGELLDRLAVREPAADDP